MDIKLAEQAAEIFKHLDALKATLQLVVMKGNEVNLMLKSADGQRYEIETAGDPLLAVAVKEFYKKELTARINQLQIEIGELGETTPK